jgi:hypothetical protein
MLSLAMDFIENLGRPIAAVGAVICCVILYRLAVGYYHLRRNASFRRTQHGWRHVAYAPLADADTFADDEDGYNDNEASPSTNGVPSSRLNSPLPDKPLPPLPYDGEDDGDNYRNDGG